MSRGSILAAYVRLTLRRFLRGGAPWLCAVIAMLPLAFVAALRGHKAFATRAFKIEQLLLVVLPAIVIASAISDDLDDRAATYLWSRPLARWSVVAGKLTVLAPDVIVIVVASWIGAVSIGGGVVSAGPVFALAAGALATAVIAVGIAVLSPRYGMVLTIVYLLSDAVIGQIPAHVHDVSVAHAPRSSREW